MANKTANNRRKELLAHRDKEKEMRVIKTAVNKQFENIKQLDLAVLNEASVKNPG